MKSITIFLEAIKAMLFRVIVAWTLLSEAAASLQVIGTGLPRTGTESLSKALRNLNYSIFDMAAIVSGQRIELVEVWRNLTWNDCANASTIKAFFEDGGPGANMTAVIGFPASRCWAELHEAFPHAKVLHTQRKDSATWWASASTTVLEQYKVFPYTALAELLPFFHAHRALVDSLWRGLVPLAERPKRQRGVISKDSLIRAYERLNAELLKTVPRERLMVLDIDATFNNKLAWEPLCAFLKRPLPTNASGDITMDFPFPHVNSRADFASKLQTASLGLLLAVTLFALFVGLAGCFFCQENSRMNRRTRRRHSETTTMPQFNQAPSAKKSQ